MKKKVLLITAILYSINFYSQNSYKKAYVIDNFNNKTNCLIKNIDWLNNPKEIEYKLSQNGEPQKTDVNSIREFGIYNESKYIRAKVKIDRSSEILSKISESRNPIFEEEKLFLKVLIQGKASLYEYYDKGLIRYFFNTTKSDIRQLVFKSYKNEQNTIVKNNMFKQQLLNNLECKNFKISNLKNLGYYKKDLLKLFKEFNNCDKSEISYLENTIKRDVFNLTIRPRLNNSSMTIENSSFNSRDIITFGNKTGIGIGLEFEFALPIKKDKWSIILEPTFQSFQSETINNNVSVILGGEIRSKIKYNSIEIPLGLRHYFLINEKSKLFVDIAYVFDLSFNSEYEYVTSHTGNTNIVEIETEQNIGLGVGYKLNEKFSLQFRYQTNRELIKHNFIWSSDFNTSSIILGYTIL